MVLIGSFQPANDTEDLFVCNSGWFEIFYPPASSCSALGLQVCVHIRIPLCKIDNHPPYPPALLGNPHSLLPSFWKTVYAKENSELNVIGLLIPYRKKIIKSFYKVSVVKMALDSRL